MLISRAGISYTVYISQYMNKFSSVTKTVQRLMKENRLFAKYRGVKLTDKGISIAIGIRNRHGFLADL